MAIEPWVEDLFASFAYTPSKSSTPTLPPPPPPRRKPIPQPPEIAQKLEESKMRWEMLKKAGEKREKLASKTVRILVEGKVRVMSTYFGIPKDAVVLHPEDEKKRKASTTRKRKTMVVDDDQKKIEEGGEDEDKKKKKKKKKRKKSPTLTAAEKRSDAYLRVPDGFYKPPRSPYKLLQENYASDPWKVMVVCLLLNVTSGKQVRPVLHEFFHLCPNAEMAIRTPEREISKVTQTLGLQKERAKKLQIFSSQYLYADWTHITQLHGIGKYAADAYAIFIGGKARQVIPYDHKLVDYWKFVCGIP